MAPSGQPRPASIYRSAAGRDAITGWCADRLAEWPVEHERRVITAHGARTHLLVAGSGERTVLVLPGAGFSSVAYLPLAAELAANCRISSTTDAATTSKTVSAAGNNRLISRPQRSRGGGCRPDFPALCG